jgi:ADP-ribose pyrophosphatase YjhB (NUDIX family)
MLLRAAHVSSTGQGAGLSLNTRALLVKLQRTHIHVHIHTQVGEPLEMAVARETEEESGAAGGCW